MKRYRINSYNEFDMEETVDGWLVVYDDVSAEIERLRADNATLRTALQNHGAAAARMVADIAELVGALAPFAWMMNEADHLRRSPDDRPVFAINNHGFSVGDLRKARAAITKHESTTTKGSN